MTLALVGWASRAYSWHGASSRGSHAWLACWASLRAPWKFPGLLRPAYARPAFQYNSMAVPFGGKIPAHWPSSMHLTLKMQASASPLVPVLSKYSQIIA